MQCLSQSFFFFNDTAATEIYTLSLHDALPICPGGRRGGGRRRARPATWPAPAASARGRRSPPPVRSARCPPDRKSTRLNSSHANISYAVFCLKKKNIRCCLSTNIELTTTTLNP